MKPIRRCHYLVFATRFLNFAVITCTRIRLMLILLFFYSFQFQCEGNFYTSAAVDKKLLIIIVYVVIAAELEEDGKPVPSVFAAASADNVSADLDVISETQSSPSALNDVVAMSVTDQSDTDTTVAVTSSPQV